jgi:hypothetical protein
MVEDGIATEATRKKISKDDAASDDAEANALFGVFGTKQKIRINKIIKDHGLYAPHNMTNDLQCVIALPAADEIMNAQGGESVEGYTLENIELEYESIDNIDLARKAEGLYGSERELSFEHATLMKKTEWIKDSTIINETTNVPRRSMKAIVMLFTNKTKADSEEYIYPNIEKVRVTIEGVPNAVYSQRIPKTRLYEEARRLFGTDEISHQTLTGFFKDKKFALVIDLRTVNDANTYGNGAKIQNTQSGILVAGNHKESHNFKRCMLPVRPFRRCYQDHKRTTCWNKVLNYSKTTVFPYSTEFGKCFMLDHQSPVLSPQKSTVQVSSDRHVSPSLPRR